MKNKTAVVYKLLARNYAGAAAATTRTKHNTRQKRPGQNKLQQAEPRRLSPWALASYACPCRDGVAVIGSTVYTYSNTLAGKQLGEFMLKCETYFFNDGKNAMKLTLIAEEPMLH